MRKMLIRSADGSFLKKYEGGKEVLMQGVIITVNGDCDVEEFDGTPHDFLSQFAAEGPSGLPRTMVREDPELDRRGVYGDWIRG